MKKQEKNEFIIALTAGAAYVGATFAWACFMDRFDRKEEEKRRKIQEWKQMNLDALAASKDRLMRLADDPSTTEADFWQAMHEEQEFMNLIHDQPIY